MSATDFFLYGAPVAAIVGFLLSPWGQPVLAAITGTRIGRYCAGAAAVAYAAFVVWSATYRAGKRAGAAGALRDVREANAQAKADRVATEAKAAGESDDALRRELSRYTPVILAVVAIGTLGLGGCVTTTGGPGKGGAFCDVEQPLRLSAPVIAAMSHDELAAAVAHNRFGERHCAWAPGRKS